MTALTASAEDFAESTLQSVGQALITNAAAVAATALVALGVYGPLKHPEAASAVALGGIGALALSGSFVMAQVSKYTNARDCAAASEMVPEISVNDRALAKMVLRAVESNAFARFEFGSWLVRKPGAKAFEAMDEAHFAAFKVDLAARGEPLVTLDITNEPDSGLKATFVMRKHDLDAIGAYDRTREVLRVEDGTVLAIDSAGFSPSKRNKGALPPMVRKMHIGAPII